MTAVFKPQVHRQTCCDQLNDDILMRIFDYLHYDDKLKLRRTCTRWRYLLDQQLKQVNTIRLGHFQLGAFELASGLQMAPPATCGPQHDQLRSCCTGGRLRQTASLFDGQLLQLPADPDTRTYAINRYDYLHRALKQAQLVTTTTTSTIRCLCLGQLQISYRLLISLTTNLPHLEHLELINCASTFEANKAHHPKALSSTSSTLNPNDSTQQMTRLVERNNTYHSLESFNCSSQQFYYQQATSNLIYNQHQDEQLNLQERLIRSTLIRNCQLIQEARRQNYWARLEHLLVKDCHLLNEFTLCLILAIASKTLSHLSVESAQYLTGEFLNYCGPQVKTIHLKHCPLIRPKFLEDLTKLKQLLGQEPKLDLQQQQQQQQQAIKQYN